MRGTVNNCYELRTNMKQLRIQERHEGVAVLDRCGGRPAQVFAGAAGAPDFQQDRALQGGETFCCLLQQGIW